jgi:tRNA A37 threonylcarbamoyladenosine dehydratase
MNNKEWQLRTELLLGEKNVEKLTNTHVLVAGLGGVGGYAVEQLARAGIGRLTIIDHDKINITNINRQIIALHTNIGYDKTSEMQKRLLEINPEIEISIINEFITEENVFDFLRNKIDYIIDAIDTLTPKVTLISSALKNNIPIISSMGAGGKFDPEKVTIADISKSHNCHLARMIRKRLHRLGIYTGFKVVYSPEKVDKDKIIATNGLRNQKSVAGTISYMPAVFGCFCASVVIRDLIELS